MEDKQQATRHYKVSKTDLPVSCPMPDQPLWALHPRVFLPLDKKEKEICPYCNAEFELVD